MNYKCKEDDLLLQVQQLRDRLHNRNLMLDVIRKAYYSDIVLIRNCILNNDRKDKNCKSKSELNTFTSELNPHRDEKKENDFVSSLPSIDLRTILPLFAPRDCGLCIKPCYTCGGQLEIVHNESEIIMQLRETCALLKSRQRNLSFQVTDI